LKPILCSRILGVSSTAPYG